MRVESNAECSMSIYNTSAINDLEKQYLVFFLSVNLRRLYSLYQQAIRLWLLLTGI